MTRKLEEQTRAMIRRRSVVAKRVFDVLASCAGIVILSPLFILVAIAIRVANGPPVLFKQERVGVGGQRFRILKFRTMQPAKHGDLRLTVEGDQRITKLGHVLRKTKLDELPQLLNVLAGQMSFVGPRPEVPDYVDHYSSDQICVLSLYPGITDPASLKYFDENRLLSKHENPHEYYIQTIMPDKIQINLEYAERASLFTDLVIIYRTLRRAVPIFGGRTS